MQVRETSENRAGRRSGGSGSHRTGLLQAEKREIDEWVLLNFSVNAKDGAQGKRETEEKKKAEA